MPTNNYITPEFKLHLLCNTPWEKTNIFSNDDVLVIGHYINITADDEAQGHCRSEFHHADTILHEA